MFKPVRFLWNSINTLLIAYALAMAACGFLMMSKEIFEWFKDRH